VLPFLGVLPDRSPPNEPDEQDEEQQPGEPNALRLRYVYEDSAAAEAGLQPGDELVSLDNEQPANTEEWRERLALYEVGNTIKLSYVRDGKTVDVQLPLGEVPAELPASVPPARERDPEAETDAEGKIPSAELVQLKLPDQPNKCVALVPGDYDDRRQYAAVVWLAPPGTFDEEEFTERWEPLVARDDLIVMAPQSQDKQRWQRTESAIVRKLFAKLQDKYNIDPNRVVAYGQGAGGALAYRFAFDNRDVVRGIAIVDAVVPLGVQVRGNDPLDRLELFAVGSKPSKFYKRMQADLEALEKMKFPVFSDWIDGAMETLSDDKFNELARWIDCLDHL
jgi:predicted esterase